MVIKAFWNRQSFSNTRLVDTELKSDSNIQYLGIVIFLMYKFSFFFDLMQNLAEKFIIIPPAEIEDCHNYDIKYFSFISFNPFLKKPGFYVSAVQVL